MLWNINSQGHVYVFHIQNFSLNISINQTFNLLGKGVINQKKLRDKQFSFNFDLGQQPVPSTKKDDLMHHTWLGFLPTSSPRTILPYINFSNRNALALNILGLWTQLEIRLISSSAIILFLLTVLVWLSDFLPCHSNTSWRMKSVAKIFSTS